MWPFRKKMLHEQNNLQCTACSKGWPRKHEICGGLFHAGAGLVSGRDILKVAQCDRCRQQIEVSTTGIQGLLSSEALEALEQALFDDVLAKAAASRRIYV